MSTPFHSRTEVGLRQPKNQSGSINPKHLTAHWAGPSPWRNQLPDHSRCASIWRGFQAFHMDSRGWSDIAYTSGVCPHGHRYEGRGVGVRTAANGTNIGNELSYATCYIAGDGDPLTQAAKTAFVDEALRLSVLLNKVHSDWKPTSCPGSELKHWVNNGASAPPWGNSTSPPSPTKPPSTIDWAAVRRMVAKQTADTLRSQETIRNGSNWLSITLLQSAINIVDPSRGLKIDGRWGPNTHNAVLDFQKYLGLTADGIVGDLTRFWLIVTLENIWKG